MDITVGLSAILKGIMSFAVLMIGFIVNRTAKAMDKIESRIEDLEKHQPNAATRSQIEALKDKMEANQKEMYSHHDKEADKIRLEINQLGNGLRKEISDMTTSVGQITGTLSQLNESVSKLNSTLMKHIDRNPN